MTEISIQSVEFIHKLALKSEFIYDGSLYETSLDKQLIEKALSGLGYNNELVNEKIVDEISQFFGSKCTCVYDVNSNKPRLKLKFKFIQGEWIGYSLLSQEHKSVKEGCQLNFTYFDGYSPL